MGIFRTLDDSMKEGLAIFNELLKEEDRYIEAIKSAFLSGCELIPGQNAGIGMMIPFLKSKPAKVFKHSSNSGIMALADGEPVQVTNFYRRRVRMMSRCLVSAELVKYAKQNEYILRKIIRDHTDNFLKELPNTNHLPYGNIYTGTTFASYKSPGTDTYCRAMDFQDMYEIRLYSDLTPVLYNMPFEDLNV